MFPSIGCGRVVPPGRGLAYAAANGCKRVFSGSARKDDRATWHQREQCIVKPGRFPHRFSPEIIQPPSRRDGPITIPQSGKWARFSAHYKRRFFSQAIPDKRPPSCESFQRGGGPCRDTSCGLLLQRPVKARGNRAELARIEADKKWPRFKRLHRLHGERRPQNLFSQRQKQPALNARVLPRRNRRSILSELTSMIT